MRERTTKEGTKKKNNGNGTKNESKNEQIKKKTKIFVGTGCLPQPSKQF